MGRGVLCLGNPDRRGVERSLEIQVGGGSEDVAIRGGGLDFLWNNPLVAKISDISEGNLF